VHKISLIRKLQCVHKIAQQGVLWSTTDSKKIGVVSTHTMGGHHSGLCYWCYWF